jgi:hypothetical protein
MEDLTLMSRGKSTDAAFVVHEDRRSRTLHIIPNPNTAHHMTRGHKCWCEFTIEKYPNYALIIHSEKKKPRRAR